MISFDCSGFVRLAGRLANMSVGMVKLVAPCGAMQTNTALVLVGRSSPNPRIAIDCPLSPPDQEIVKGCVRLRIFVVSRFVQVNGGGMVKEVENGPTSMPPNPCSL